MKNPPSLNLACIWLTLALQSCVALVVHRPPNLGWYTLGFFTAYLGFVLTFRELKGWWKS
ncbi:hypothetical protein SAMN05518800_1787 [Variovorax sp. YR752]|uniref:hypothetical protein n=1 Tax=Variovorax sp. YR752 TaxID=1884383 RepID=UPI000BCCAB5D|nr:hypothetical protein [Variovorax sp. YR752]SOD25195.1 hypothetical protein SAMN05518800_1787 [Variovorax sp. YR752]